MLRCSVCRDRFKSVAITRCFHLFCKECIEENLRTRHRKCPACGEKFGQDDVRSVYFTHWFFWNVMVDMTSWVWYLFVFVYMHNHHTNRPCCIYCTLHRHPNKRKFVWENTKKQLNQPDLEKARKDLKYIINSYYQCGIRNSIYIYIYNILSIIIIILNTNNTNY